MPFENLESSSPVLFLQWWRNLAALRVPSSVLGEVQPAQALFLSHISGWLLQLLSSLFKPCGAQPSFANDWVYCFSEKIQTSSGNPTPLSTPPQLPFPSLHTHLSMSHPLPSRSWVSSQTLHLVWLSASTLTHPLPFLLTIHGVGKGVHDMFGDPRESRTNGWDTHVNKENVLTCNVSICISIHHGEKIHSVHF